MDIQSVRLQRGYEEKRETTKGGGFSMDRERKLVGDMDIKRGDSRSIGENNELNRSHF